MNIIPYNRDEAVKYAKKWAMSRNPKYFNFDGFGGDCTNFVSQCIYAGTDVMNFTPVTGWYYINSDNRTASWTGVEYLYKFLINNKSVGPSAIETDEMQVELGDIIQIGNSLNEFYHSSIISGFDSDSILVCSHTYDSYMRPLNSYSYYNIRYLHINFAKTSKVYI